MKSLMEAVGSAYVKESAWIGLERGSSWKWQWSLADPGFYRQGETEFRKWGDLILVPENKSWNEALSYCRQHHVDLVSVSTEQLQHWVERRAQTASTPYVWLGLRYTCVLHFWFWVSGEGVCYQNWAPGNETGECGHTGAVESGGRHQWVSLPETEELNFICSKATGESGTEISSQQAAGSPAG
ncbi:hypothetical protein MATL_G00199620 [Megalops atlanticus]|uniref:C-type lectin domain-containing protein n=1 Tax=Megalops atlanticus TaxID=7932 RepID=A0A9D3PPU7_MEGAT|nr:hypothetical protein MATL_G00199620 [Megalops atlanticus]